MTRARDPERRALLARARTLVEAGVSITDAAATVGLTVDQVKKPAVREKWVAGRDAAAPTRVPPEDVLPVSAVIERRIRDALDDPKTPARDLPALHAFCLEREEHRKASNPPDYSAVPAEALRVARWALKVARGEEAGPSPLEATHARLAAAEAEPATLRADLEASRAALAEVTEERDRAQREAEALAGELETERSRVRGLEALLSGRAG